MLSNVQNKKIKSYFKKDTLFRFYYLGKKPLLLIYFIVTVANSMYAQSKLNYSDTKLPPLAELLEIAYQNSPLISSKSMYAEQNKISLSLKKKMWLRTISINGNYSRSTGVDQIEGANLPLINSTRLSNWYGAGIGINMPLSVIFNRKNNIGFAKLDQQIQQNDFLQIKRKIKERVTELYNDVKLNKLRDYFRQLTTKYTR